MRRGCGRVGDGEGRCEDGQLKWSRSSSCGRRCGCLSKDGLVGGWDGGMGGEPWVGGDRGRTGEDGVDGWEDWRGGLVFRFPA